MKMISVYFINIKTFIVIRKGEEGECMYIIYQGEVNVIAGDENKITTTLN
jgi:CRP-like cAMP-binding protein